MLGGLLDSLVLLHPWALLLVPAVLALAWPPAHVRRATLRSPSSHLLRELGPTWRTHVGRATPWLHLTGMVLLALVLTRPQVREPETRQVEGIDIVIALDVSGSMIATDLTESEIRAFQTSTGTNPPNRLDLALETLRDVVRSREHDRIALVLFARDAYLHFPLTLDYDTVIELVSSVELGLIDPAGTAIGNALGLGLRALADSSAQSRAILLITDGKQEGGNVSPREMAQLAADEGIGIYSVLIGRDGPVFAPARLCESPPCPPVPYVPARYPIDPQLLEDMAQLTAGDWFHAIRPEEIEIGLQQTLAALERTRVEDITRASRRDVGWPLLLLSLLLLGLAYGLRTQVVRRFPQ